MWLEAQHIGLHFRRRQVLEDISFNLQQGRIGCLLGPSGCGKTTVLRSIAGFEKLSQGSIQVRGRCLSGPGIHIAAEHRKIGMVFQDYGLFPHLNVEKNIAFGLSQTTTAERNRIAGEFIERVGLGGSEKAMPHQLSGGEQQRVALARALAPQPALLLLDEPFSNLDVTLREKLSEDVRDIIKASNTTALLVTHDQQEAFAVADEIGVLRDGRLQQWGSPHEIYHRPANPFVADFVGQGVLLEGTTTANKGIETALGAVHINPGQHAALESGGAGSKVKVLIRPDDIAHDDSSGLRATIRKKAFRGAIILYTLELDNGETVLALIPSHHNYSIGDAIGIRLALEEAVVFPV